MKISYLRDFLVLAEVRNYSEAAYRLFMSQSTLTRHIQKLEQDLNIPLFERNTRCVTLDKGGELILPFAEELVRIEDECLAFFTDKRRKYKLDLSIGCIPFLIPHVYTEFLNDFRENNPESRVSVQEASSDKLKQSVRDGLCDFAFVRWKKEDSAEFRCIHYSDDYLIAVISAGHPLAGEQIIQLAWLKDETFFLPPERTEGYQMSIKLCQSCGFTPHVAYIGNLSRINLERIGEGAGVSVMSRKAFEAIALPSVVGINIEPVGNSEIHVIYSKSNALTVPQNIFLRYLKHKLGGDILTK